jgi:hypothetical protein
MDRAERSGHVNGLPVGRPIEGEVFVGEHAKAIGKLDLNRNKIHINSIELS